MSRSQYSAITLRYVHDLVTGEFVNVGLLLICADRGFCQFKVATRTRRILEFFPGTRAITIRSALRAAQLTGAALATRGAGIVSSASDKASALLEVAHQIVPRDDSALQWSSVSTGLTHDPASTFDRLMDRLVLRYQEATASPKRTDDQVWKTFSRVLEQRNVAQHLQEHEIQAKVETVKFKHALKNGKWHVMEPVSFDLSNDESITDKAKRLLGQMSLLKGRSAEFKMYFLVGEPRAGEVQDGYEKALQILDEIPFDKAIYPEARADEFAAELANLVSH